MFTDRPGLRFVSLAFVPALLSLFLFPAPAAGQQCSNATLKGTFGVLERGTIWAQLPDVPAPPVAFSNVALATYDGQGNFSGTYTASDSGVVTSGTFSGTYTVNQDCSVSDEFTIQPFGVSGHHAGAIVGHGAQQEIDFIYTDQWLAATGVAKRTPAGGCSAQALVGKYVEAYEGALVGKPLVPVVQTGIVTFDRAGNFSGTFSSNLSSGPGEGNYTVHPDCTVWMGDDTGITSLGVITGEGPFQELQNMFTVNWVVLSGAMKRLQ